MGKSRPLPPFMHLHLHPSCSPREIFTRAQGIYKPGIPPTNPKSFRPKSHLEPLPLAVAGQESCPSHVLCSAFCSVLLPVYLITSLVWAPIPTLLLSGAMSDHLGWGWVHKQLPLLASLSFWLYSPFTPRSSMSKESCENCFSCKTVILDLATVYLSVPFINSHMEI